MDKKPVDIGIGIETVVVGAGQAGLATGYHLQRQGRPFVILDANARVGDHWRQQWDSLRLFTPAKYDALPGLPFPAKGWSFPGKDDVADYLEEYAKHWQLPIRLGVHVRRLSPTSDGGYLVTTDRETYVCSNVVVATGTFGKTPHVPAIARDLDPAIVQLHSSEYRRPSQLRDGPVLVVGASHSGTEIAYETAGTHATTLVGRDCGQIPVRHESWRMRLLFPILLFAWRHLLTRRTSMGRKEMAHLRFHGAPMLRVKSSDLATRGVERAYDRVEEVRSGRPVVGGEPRPVANVIWATGFRQAFDWIQVPIVGEDGWPIELRGVVERAPGLYFCGLSFQYAFSSMLLAGVGRDAAHVASHIVAAAPSPARTHGERRRVGGGVTSSRVFGGVRRRAASVVAGARLHTIQDPSRDKVDPS
ncbi:flavin-containing monooxygenase [Microbacterium ulmi]|uniref:NAD(P)-binding domain-containing protein n=1 Tax=Microbacterium ulmi TaxID=179095 RepID=A0A7Y2M271_9MICO|nr:NAD(P)-binding domain-containing protein [Microbacterium ulmi]NII68869.1 putative flavoprotein involved in K+ transport [Microbacterium ulmi]NNH05135.1 NAD(P)-binding domain-containing protein [Microbacterium ulmi]